MSVNSAPYPRIGLGTANPNTCYDQTIMADMFGHKQARIKKLFENSHIRKRFLYFPEPGKNGLIQQEDSATLQKKHLSGSLKMGAAAVNKRLREQNLIPVTLTIWPVLPVPDSFASGGLPILQRHLTSDRT
jgi:hypothetical protein